MTPPTGGFNTAGTMTYTLETQEPTGPATMRSPMAKASNNINAGIKRATKVTLAYAVVAAAWILLSDTLVEILPTGVATRTLQSMKGLLFVAVTSLALFSVLKRVFGSLEEKNSALKEERRELEVTLQELHHRVKNNLQLMNSIFALQARGESEEVARRTLLRAQQRVFSIALVHELAYQEDKLEFLAMNHFVRELVANLPEEEHEKPHRPAPRVAVEPFALDVTSAVPLGIILQELVTNAWTHGRGEGEQGYLDISLTKAADVVTLTVTDSGAGSAAELLESEKTGYVIIHTLVEQLEGTLSVDRSNGIRVTLHFPCVTEIVQPAGDPAAQTSE